MRDDRGATAENGVAGEQCTVCPQQQADRVAAVPRREDGQPLETGDLVRRLVAERIGTDAQRGVTSDDRCTGQLAETQCALRVVRMAVRQDDEPDRTLFSDAGEVPLVEGTGVDD